MRMSLARAFLNTNYVIIDSDLMSLDKVTRGKVIRNIRQYVAKTTDLVVIMKGKKGDEDLDKHVNDYITV